MENTSLRFLVPENLRQGHQLQMCPVLYDKLEKIPDRWNHIMVF